ncbi:MAG: phenylacetate-CoA oxygenase subunit PaaC [Nocardioidaceae bacterium]|nr:phenylacetate-CoA oxygenase subunit PaaC [Nocardioidaceae bacterium]
MTELSGSSGHLFDSGCPDTWVYVLRLADDALIYAQRLAEWIASAPQLEEDVALGNIALDQLGQARSLLTYAGAAEGAGRDEDALAYFRDERDFVNAQIFELGRGDFGFTVARMLVAAAYQWELYSRLQHSTDETLAAVAAKAVKEVDYHRDHATQWALRLGDGTEESHARLQAGLDSLWPYVAELFESDDLVASLAAGGIAVDPAELEEPTLAYVEGVLAEATLRPPQTDVRHSGGRRGVHTELMGFLLAEMQHLARSHPGARW